MQEFELKYGFLTTYETTLFLKQERTKSNDVLYCSAPIYSSTKSSLTEPSLRECLFYLQHLVKATEANPEPWRFVNQVSTEDTRGILWFVKMGKGETALMLKKRRDDALEEVDESLEKWRSSQVKRGAVPTKSGDPQGDQLADDFSKINLETSGIRTRSSVVKGVSFHEDTKKK
jgi:hypothetical protein